MTEERDRSTIKSDSPSWPAQSPRRKAVHAEHLTLRLAFVILHQPDQAGRFGVTERGQGHDFGLLGDLEQSLARLLQERPLVLNKLLRFVFESASVELKASGHPRWGRKSEVVAYRLTAEFMQAANSVVNID